MTQGRLGITLSCGEQTEEVYRHWFDLGAKRYLLRIETSSNQLYRKLHPDDKDHHYVTRLNALESLKKIGYQLGTGVMIGLPFQSIEDLADDLLFMKRMDIAMCGMGPYVEHHETPLYAYKNLLLPLSERLSLSLKMIAVLRMMMSDINIAATTALQSIDKNARMKAIEIGANVLMPNITPRNFRNYYFLYENKPISSQSDEEELRFLEEQLRIIGHEIGFFRQGNSLHYQPLR
jgi:biotin synthase